MYRSCFAGTINEKFVENLDIVQRLFEGSNGCLSSLSAKNHVSYSLGLYGKELFNDVHLVKEIRNTFAHAKSYISFESDAVKNKVNEFRVARSNPELKETELLDLLNNNIKCNFMITGISIYANIEALKNKLTNVLNPPASIW